MADPVYRRSRAEYVAAKTDGERAEYAVRDTFTKAPRKMVVGLEIHPDDLLDERNELEAWVYVEQGRAWVKRAGFTWKGGRDSGNPWIRFRSALGDSGQFRIEVKSLRPIRYKERIGE